MAESGLTNFSVLRRALIMAASATSCFFSHVWEGPINRDKPKLQELRLRTLLLKGSKEVWLWMTMVVKIPKNLLVIIKIGT